MNKTISKGKFQTGYGVLVILITIGFFFFCRYLFQNTFSSQYLQISRLIAAIIFSSCFLYILFKSLSEYKAVNVYEDHLKVKWLFGLVAINLKPVDILQYGATSVDKTDYIYLRRGKADILLNVTFLDNNTELIEQLRTWRVKRKDRVIISDLSKLERRIGDFLMKIIGAFLCIMVFYSSYINVRNPIGYESLTRIKGHLSETPYIDHATIKSPSMGVTIRLKEYPSIKFEIGEPGYKAMNIAEVKYYKEGTQVALLIETTEYQKKITRLSSASFSDKHFGWNSIEAFEAELSGQMVLTLTKFNEEAAAIHTSNRRWGVIIIIIIGFVFFGGLKLFR